MIKPNTRLEPQLQCADIRLDLAAGYLYSNSGSSLRLSPIAQKIMQQLVVHAGELVTRTELFASVWPNQLVSEDALTRAMSDLRGQLNSLDSSTTFIETLPKRGYRWLPVLETLAAGEVGQSLPSEPVDSPAQILAVPSLIVADSKRAMFRLPIIYSGLGVLLAMLVMMALTELAPKAIYRLAVLPTQLEFPAQQLSGHQVDSVLFEVLRADARIDLLSNTAVASRPTNPFPYFFNEFNARWVLETRLGFLDGMTQVELSLVDARSGVERRHLRLDAVNPADLRNLIASQLLPQLLDDLEDY